MIQMIQQLIAGLLASITLGGGSVTVTEIPSPPGSIDPENPPGLTEFTAMVPDAARIDCNVNVSRTGGADGLVPDGADWTESFSLIAYDAEGNLIGSTSGSANIPAPAMTTILYDYDGAGNCVRTEEYNGDRLLTMSEQTYDAQSRSTGYTLYEDGALQYTNEYTYAAQPDGTLRCTQTTRRADGTTSEESYVVDQAGNPLHTENQIGGKTITTDFIYDEKGRPTLVVYDYGAAVPSETRYAYTDAADGSYTCTVELYDNGVLVSRSTLRYDGLGICVSEQECGPDGRLLREMTVYTLQP